ncbi:unnamed protein product [Spirodela intermedia]|uniref:Uncharacterized protein n=1 Tax=Spirodela intermedia TaxID=51605 RepID=A0A7I8KKX1_SPIIN|nr:unnamed protein product [Spirodela intermedia]
MSVPLFFFFLNFKYILFSFLSIKFIKNLYSLRKILTIIRYYITSL